jgi:hypothetical protein
MPKAKLYAIGLWHILVLIAGHILYAALFPLYIILQGVEWFIKGFDTYKLWVLELLAHFDEQLKSKK